jgi:hypothetical protein
MVEEENVAELQILFEQAYHYVNQKPVQIYGYLFIR